MNFESLEWKPMATKTVFTSRPFDIHEIISVSPRNTQSTFYSLYANDWVIVIPVLSLEQNDDTFLLVWQWRHGSNKLSLEFPGGVIDEGETAEQAAHRELIEETGYEAGSLELLSSVFPNPAIMSNTCHIFLAKDLVKTQKIALDDDEFVEVETRPVNQVLNEMGKDPFNHGLMSTALLLYIQKKGVFNP